MATLSLSVGETVAKEVAKLHEMSGKSLSETVRGLLKEAVRAGVKAKPQGGEPTKVLRFALGTPEYDWFLSEAQSKVRKGDEQRWLAGVLSRYIYKTYIEPNVAVRKPGAGRPKDFEAEAKHLFETHTSGLSERKEQISFISLLNKAVDNRKIVMAQASTGVGKSAGMLLAAIRAITQKKQRVVIASPTQQVMRQLVAEYGSMGKTPSSAVLLGRQEYVCVQKLRSLLENDPDIEGRDVVKRWLDSGGEPLPETPFQINWLAETLLQIAPTFPVGDVLLPRIVDDGVREDEGYLSYQSMFDHAGESSLVFCTHAMLASDLRVRGYFLQRDDEVKAALSDDVSRAMDEAEAKLRSDSSGVNLKETDVRKARGRAYIETLAAHKAATEGVIPGGFDVLFVDEAHELERIIASSASLDVSVYRMFINSKVLSSSGGVKAAATKVKKIYKTLVSMEVNSGKGYLGVSRDSLLFGLLKSLIEAARKLVGSVENKGSVDGRAGRALTEMKGQVADLSRLMSEISSKGRIGQITWTPVRRYPRILVGPVSVAHELDVLWQSVTGGAVVSASLYLPPPHEHVHMATVLNVPQDKLMISPPITTPWLYKPVTVHLPVVETSDSGRLWLRTPEAKAKGEKLEAQTQRWAIEAATVVNAIAMKSQGGTLVLGTSYDGIAALYAELFDKLGDRLVKQSNNERFEVTVAKYKQLYYDGKRPVFLALGRAWTGLDLTDDRKGSKASSDHMISDLVVLRIPFGVNQSSTHRIRVKKRFTVEALDSALLFLQGLGRLVRREGVPEKHIWILDPRIASDQPRHREDTKHHREMLKKYRKKVTFTRKEMEEVA